MNPPKADAPHCVVTGADKLPAEAGGVDLICASIRTAAAEKAPGVPFAVTVRVDSASSMVATVKLADGKALPEQKLAVSDRQLNRGSIERFAAAVATEIARASGH